MWSFKGLISSIIWVVAIWSCNGHVYENPLPGKLRDCLRFMEKKSNILKTPSEAIDYMCINKYIYQTPELRWKPKITPEIDSMLLKDLKRCKKDLGLGQTSSKRVLYTKRSVRNHLIKEKRKKRQAAGKVFRKEYRMMTNEERARFHRAVLLLKQDTSVQPNLYDAICNLHPNVRAPNAHYGPAFLGYHRVLLWFFEKQLQRKVPGVYLPFWDSTKDSLMANPTASVIFSQAFAGTGNGVVNNGPFANFRHPAVGVLVRNLEAGGDLMTRRDIANIVRQTRTADMMTPYASSENNLELCHAKVHAWIGGTLDNLNYSPADPLFWMHHCYVDYIWELQRQNERRGGRDPDTDYPSMDDGHNADGIMYPFTNLRNKDGFNRGWIDTYYGYEDAPVRCRRDDSCRSTYYKCTRGLCCSRTIGEVYGVGQQQTFGRKKRSAPTKKSSTYSGKASSLVKKAPVVTKPVTDIQTHLKSYFPYLAKLGDSAGTFYKFKHGQSAAIKPGPEKVQDLSFEDLDLHTTGLYHSFQNSFTLDGVEDTKNWVYLPVIVYYRRPAEVKYDAHPIRNGKVMANMDVYSTTRADKYHLGKPVKTATSSTCKHIGSGAFKVYVKAYGLSYDGVFTDYAVVDERQPLSFALTQVGVQNPRMKNTTVYVTAYDSCNRQCKARCLIPGSKPARYKPCSGTIRVTPDAPFMYSSDIADAHLHTYDYNTIPPCLSYDKIFLVFYCDQKDSWPWQQSMGPAHVSSARTAGGWLRPS
ncbi:hypothetical protein FSP39_015807 [Pinctada imbricata]|uniref:Tyrosinase copper-binding domain-containing protein n=1 Tax=Pinctada imbricata TaxID=66713 RepID=A0AA89C6N4_PINIB|nr:hypothetical protein FSP39_015807 [Pinctada imbricata]